MSDERQNGDASGDTPDGSGKRGDWKYDDWEKRDRLADKWAQSDARWQSWETKSRKMEGSSASDGGVGEERPAGSRGDQSWQGAYRGAGPYLSIGLNMATTIVLSLVIFLGGGAWLDKRFGWAPWLTIVGALLAFVAMGYSLSSMIRQLNRLDGNRTRRSGADSKGD